MTVAPVVDAVRFFYFKAQGSGAGREISRPISFEIAQTDIGGKAPDVQQESR